MTRQEYENNYLIIDGLIFSPKYIKTQIEVIENGETILIDDYTITATAQEVYSEWQSRKNFMQQPSQQDTLNAQLLKDNASMKVEINNQKALNSQLLLEIAKLKGGNANV